MQIFIYFLGAVLFCLSPVLVCLFISAMIAKYLMKKALSGNELLVVLLVSVLVSGAFAALVLGMTQKATLAASALTLSMALGTASRSNKKTQASDDAGIKD